MRGVATSEKLTQAIQKVQRRTEMARQAMHEYNELIEDINRESVAKSISIPVNKTIQAELLGISRSHLYKIGLDGCRTYAELWKKVDRRRPDLLPTLEKNFNAYLEDHE